MTLGMDGNKWKECKNQWSNIGENIVAMPVADFLASILILLERAEVDHFLFPPSHFYLALPLY